jgi:exosortase
VHLELNKRFWLRAAVPLAVMVVTFVLVLPVITHALQIWSDNDDMRFGYLLAPTAALLVWRSWPSLRRPSGPDATAHPTASLVLVIVAVGLYVVCERLAARSPAAIAAGILIWAEVWYLWGRSRAFLMAFPIGLIAYGLALQPTLVSPLGFSLQQLTAVSAASVGHLIGLSIVREGLVLRGDAFAFIVAEACSGMNSLLALMSLAAVWVYLVRGTIGARAAVIASVLPLTIAANTTRVVTVMVIANEFGEDAALGFFHGASSLILFGLALAGMLMISRVVGCRTSLAA